MPLAVVEPLDVVGRADVNIAVVDLACQRALEVGGDGLGLGDLLGLETLTLEHVLEVHVAADIELVGAVEHDAAILEQLRHHAVVMVAPTCDLMSSPTIGTPASVNFFAQTGSEAMKTGSALTKATPASMQHWA